MNTFEMKTAIHFGADALGRLKDIPYKRVLVVTDPFVVKSGMIDMITKPLQAGGKEFDIFCDVVPDALAAVLSTTIATGERLVKVAVTVPLPTASTVTFSHSVPL